MLIILANIVILNNTFDSTWSMLYWTVNLTKNYQRLFVSILYWPRKFDKNHEIHLLIRYWFSNVSNWFFSSSLQRLSINSFQYQKMVWQINRIQIKINYKVSKLIFIWSLMFEIHNHVFQLNWSHKNKHFVKFWIITFIFIFCFLVSGFKRSIKKILLQFD